MLKRRGFTLLELMVVVIIVGILASLALPQFIKTAERAREAEAKNMLGVIRSSQMRYVIESNGAYTANLADLDVTVQPSIYFTYTAVNGAGAVVGRANKLPACGAGCNNWEIQIDGTLVAF